MLDTTRSGPAPLPRSATVNSPSCGASWRATVSDRWVTPTMPQSDEPVASMAFSVNTAVWARAKAPRPRWTMPGRTVPGASSGWWLAVGGERGCV